MSRRRPRSIIDSEEDDDLFEVSFKVFNMLDDKR